MSFTNESIALPPHRASRFTIECDLEPRTARAGPPLDFKIYYALAHYHELGTGITVEAVRADGTRGDDLRDHDRVGDALGGADRAGASRWPATRSCGSRATSTTRATTTVRWGVGDAEMCTFLAFTDSA